jgi:putative glutamine amidotransferase
VVPGSRLHAVAGGLRLGVNTLHHQAVDLVGEGLVVSGWSTDGIVEAIEAIGDRPLLGVQWHPELLPAHEAHRLVFAWLVAAAEAGARGEHDDPRMTAAT